MQQLAELAGALGLWVDQAQPKFAAALAEGRQQILDQLAGQAEGAALDERMHWMAQWLGLEEPPAISRETYQQMSGLMLQLVKESKLEKFMIFDRILLFSERREITVGFHRRFCLATRNVSR